MQSMTPRQIVAELDKYIIGQGDAKRAVAVAVRNRWRRQQLPEQMRQDIWPKNIIMSGPTGVGKTEIARRLANLTARRLSRSKPPSTPRWGITAAMWKALFVIWLTWRLAWCAAR